MIQWRLGTTGLYNDIEQSYITSFTVNCFYNFDKRKKFWLDQEWYSSMPCPGNPYCMGRISTVNLLALTSSDQLLFILKISFFLFYKTSYHKEEVNCLEPSSSVRVVCLVYGYHCKYQAPAILCIPWVNKQVLPWHFYFSPKALKTDRWCSR
jgi:hypothetical protein